MRFSLPDLHQNDRAGICRRNACVASTIFHFYSSLIIEIFLHKAVASERSYPRHVDASIRMIRVYLQYNAILHGKELHHE
jgi:hypothetical protein